MTMTIGDVIRMKKQADRGSADAKAAFEAAERAYSAARNAVEAADGQLKVALAQSGPAFVNEGNGSIEIFLPDPAGGGYTLVKPVAVSTPVDLPGAGE